MFCGLRGSCSIRILTINRTISWTGTSMYLSMCVSVCVYDCLHDFLSVWMTVCLSVWMTVCLFVCLFICMTVCQSFCLFVSVLCRWCLCACAVSLVICSLWCVLCVRTLYSVRFKKNIISGLRETYSTYNYHYQFNLLSDVNRHVPHYSSLFKFSSSFA